MCYKKSDINLHKLYLNFSYLHMHLLDVYGDHLDFLSNSTNILKTEAIKNQNGVGLSPCGVSFSQ